MFEDDETLRMYMDESLEHLADIETDLLAIEGAGANIDEDLVNNVFRAAHSIKGGAGFMGLTTIKDLAHHLENILGLIRSRELVPGPEIISTLLNSFDKLRELINAIETSNDIDIAAYVTSLEALTVPSESDKESVSTHVDVIHPPTGTVFSVKQFDLQQAVKQGKFVYIIEYDLIADIHQKNKTPLDVIAVLLSSGIIIDARVDLEAVGTLETPDPVNIPFLVVFASIIEPDMAHALVELDEKQIFQIDTARYDIPSLEAIEEATKDEIPESDTTLSVEATKDMPPDVTDIPDPILPDPEPDLPPVAETGVTAAPSAPLSQANAANPAPQKNKADWMEAAVLQDSRPSKNQQTSLRVNVNLLDTLMNLAGELVLSRNQLLQSLTSNNTRTLETASQRIDMITSELQEAVMYTRMQPISNIFNKFTRVVRDLARNLGKQVDLSMQGKEVELDKTIIESISDPLTHLVRNAVDHGIEPPHVRKAMGKDPIGQIRLRAFHQAGQVNIEITDDGKGLNGDELMQSALSKGLITEKEARHLSEQDKIGLIFLPGFSTAKEISDVSGRGVGMDVVKTNLDNLGGIVELDSKVGSGTTIHIKLPLTLAIIPSQIINVGQERFAIPQVNLNELLRIPAAQVKDKIEKVGGAEVVRLRGNLLPLLNLSEVLGIERTFVHPETGDILPDRRTRIADRRSKNDADPVPSDDVTANQNERSLHDRRYHASSAINIAVVSAGTFRYGLVVDDLNDSEEIVVKPLGRHLKDCKGYAGATIMGDGKVALILDVANLAQMAQLTTVESAESKLRKAREAREIEDARKDRASLLLFRVAENEHFAALLNLVERIERINSADIETLGGRKVVQYRGGSLPLIDLSEVTNVKPLPEKDQRDVIVFTVAGREIGLIVTPPVDAVEVALEIDDSTLRQTGIMGSLIVGDHTTLMVDIFDVVRTVHPDWFTAETQADQDNGETKEYTILFAEDSAFFRNQVKGFLEEEGFAVIPAADGQEALEILEEQPEAIDIVVTDLEMPRMDGFQLTNKIKSNPKFNHLSVIALTSLAGQEDIDRGQRVGIDDYQIKLDREKLVESTKRYLGII
ncbi:MAG: hybrid sensor histidine kinase/response regulator [Deltaproteobacteria bacterium]|nr:MAG: hybrid sensor histidine kinase/response regulator [Deltaproteobacteria bacterium]